MSSKKRKKKHKRSFIDRHDRCCWKLCGSKLVPPSGIGKGKAGKGEQQESFQSRFPPNTYTDYQKREQKSSTK
tara:strand:- start:27 stop:245 length:219 start_codon:yes stop_codon:yes gene_type:complete